MRFDDRVAFFMPWAMSIAAKCGEEARPVAERMAVRSAKIQFPSAPDMIEQIRQEHRNLGLEMPDQLKR